MQTLSSASGQQPWFGASFSQLGGSTNDVARLPFDHHRGLVLVAPRALFVVDDTSVMWPGHESSFTTSVLASDLCSALGAAMSRHPPARRPRRPAAPG